MPEYGFPLTRILYFRSGIYGLLFCYCYYYHYYYIFIYFRINQTKQSCNWNEATLTLLKMEAKRTHTSFPPVTSVNVEISPQNFLTLLTQWCEISRPYLVPVPNYWTWTKTTPQKSGCFGQIPIKSRLW